MCISNVLFAQVTATGTITVNTVPSITSATETDVTICGGSDGTITITATGFAPLTYSIDGGSTFIANGGIFTGLTAANYPIAVKNGYGCITYGATLVIGAGGAPPAPVAGTNATYCQGATASDLTATAGSGGTIKWYSDPGLTTQIGTGSPFNPNPYLAVGTNNFYVTETVAGCQSAATMVTITITTLPVATFSYTGTPYCSNGTDPLPTYSGGGVAGTFSSTAGLVFISTSTGQVDLSASTAGTYTVTNTIAASGGCGIVTATSPITINPSPVAIISPGNVSICSGQDTTLTASGGASYLWSTGATTAAITPSPTTTATYTVTVTSGAGCTATTSATVTVNTTPTASISSGTTTICSGNSTTLTASGGGTYQWSQGGTNPDITVSPVITTTYTVTVSNSCGNDTANVVIYVNLTPVAFAGNDTTILIGNSVQLNATGGTTYQWAPSIYLDNPNIYNPISTPLNDISYIVIVTNEFGCADADTINIIVDETTDIFIPDIFSPNGDGNNDILYVRGKGIKELNFVIYDRWGEKVFESHSINDGWDGTFKGKSLIPAVFVYYLEVTFINGKHKTNKGDVTLIR